ncbi:MAG: alkaline phosphatase [Cyclobacteriaceae bacterium]|nr:alkaline phosphatase [Cyclobacteriaceae bacterium]
MVRTSFDDLLPGHKYYYRLHYGREKDKTATSGAGIFKTNPGAKNQADLAMVIVTGMNYYHFHYGNYDSTKAYNGPDKALGYPALKSVLALAPDYFIGTGDNVYFDHPNEQGFKNSLKNHKKPHPGGYDGKEVVDEAGMRRKYHEQFSQQNFKALFAKTATYWEKDDHDYRLNDADPYTDFAISHELGINNFKEQLPVVYPGHKGTTYRTHQLSKDLQLWFLEGRDYRDANEMTDGPTKSLWGKEQLAWLKSSLLQSTATYKILVSPTPMVGPDDAYKRDNHVNPDGFRYEGEAFFDWLIDNGFLDKNFYIVCGDRHWKYHARHPKGIEEFSTGALVDNNARPGRLAGDPQSTDPDGKIIQYYIQGTEEQASGGFLLVKIALDSIAKLQFQFYDEQGKMLYQAIKNPVAEDGQ